MLGPSPDVLDLFAVPDAAQPLPGAREGRVRAGDLVLSPGRYAETATWSSPVLARLAVGLDERPGRRRRDLRVAMPVPARDGSWVVQGWGASRWEPGTQLCEDPAVVRAAGRLFHAELASAVGARPAGLPGWPGSALGDLPDTPVVRRVRPALLDPREVPLGPEQLVHTELAGNVLLDAAGAPVVLDVVPAWGPARWAEALCVLDTWAATWAAPGLEPGALDGWTTGPERQAMLRAVLHRSLSGAGSYEPVLVALGV